MGLRIKLIIVTCLVNIVMNIHQACANIKDPVVDLDLNNEEVLKAKWDEFKTVFHKDYKTAKEDDYRFHVFSNNIKQIKLWNEKDFDTNKYGLTRYCDLTEQEMWRHTGFVPEGYELFRNTEI